MTTRYVLDSWAVLHLLEGGANASVVDDAMHSGTASMSWVNLGEVDDIVQRHQGQLAADAVVSDLRARVDVRLPAATVPCCREDQGNRRDVLR